MRRVAVLMALALFAAMLGQNRPVAARPHRVGEGGYGRVQYVAVGPYLVVAGVAAAEHGHARRHADGRGAVGVFQHRPLGRQAIQVRRLDQGVAVAAGDVGAVLVRMDIE